MRAMRGAHKAALSLGTAGIALLGDRRGDRAKRGFGCHDSHMIDALDHDDPNLRTAAHGFLIAAWVHQFVAAACILSELPPEPWMRTASRLFHMPADSAGREARYRHGLETAGSWEDRSGPAPDTRCDRFQLRRLTQGNCEHACDKQGEGAGEAQPNCQDPKGPTCKESGHKNISSTASREIQYGQKKAASALKCD